MCESRCEKNLGVIVPHELLWPTRAVGCMVLRHVSAFTVLVYCKDYTHEACGHALCQPPNSTVVTFSSIRGVVKHAHALHM